MIKLSYEQAVNIILDRRLIMDEKLVMNDKDSEIVVLSKLSKKEKDKVDKIANKIDITDSEAVIQYGVNVQSEISEFSDEVLDKVKSNESGYVGEVLSDLMVNVKEIDVDDIAGKQGFFSKIFGNMKNKYNRFMARYQKLGAQIDVIVDKLDDAKTGLLADINLLDNLHEKNLSFMKNLEYYVLAGELKLDEIKDKVLPELKAKAKASDDQADAQRFNDMKQLAERFEKKIHDLRLSRMITVQTSPQLRLIQNNDQVLVEKIQSSILNTIPLWKNQIVIAISLYRQQTALDLQKQVSDTTNDLLKRNSELLKENSIETAKESERGIVDLETLQMVNNNLIETIDEVIRIQKEGKVQRALAEKELISMEKALKQKILTTTD
jgi:uncharacterized protein YaaN involved in tellurite resistance